MRKFLGPAALAISILSTSASAEVVQGTIDGVVYALPGQSRFQLQTMHLPQPENLQASVDEIRKNAPPNKVLILFSSRPASKDAPQALSPVPLAKKSGHLEPILTLYRDPVSTPAYRQAIDDAIKDAVFQGGIAKITVNKPGTDKPMFARSYAIRTGLSFAPDADAHCDDQKVGTRCFVDVARPGRHRLRWTSLILDETSPQAVRAHVRVLIANALPVEMKKEGEKERKKVPSRP